MRKNITLLVLLLSFTYTWLQAQNIEDALVENTPREIAFGLKTTVRFGQTNFFNFCGTGTSFASTGNGGICTGVGSVFNQIGTVKINQP